MHKPTNIGYHRLQGIFSITGGNRSTRRGFPNFGMSG
jgi:hypothetical protein